MELDGRQLDGVLGDDRTRLLLAYLVAHRPGPVASARLAGVLGEDAEGEVAERVVQAPLEHLREALGELVAVSGDEVSLRLEPDAWVDVEAAEEALLAAEARFGADDPAGALAAAQVAAGLLESPYLEEFDGACVRERRRQLEDVRAVALHRVASAALAVRPPVPALAERAASQLGAMQPYRQSAYALRMEALAQLGRRAEAIAVYDEIARRLQDELGTDPGPVLVRVRDRILSGPESRATVPAARSPVPLPPFLARLERRALLGRDASLVALREQWTRALGGEGGLVLVGGDPGIGKTRLAARLAVEAHAAGATVLFGRADEQGVVLYQPWAEALRHYLTHRQEDPAVAAVVPELSALAPDFETGTGADDGEGEDGGAGEAPRHRLFDAVTELLETAAAERPVLVVLDDLHWADTPALLLLRDVVRRAAGSRLLVVGTWRDREAEPGGTLARVVGDLRRDDLVHTLALAGLDEAATAALVAREGPGAGDGDLVHHLHDRTGGNPFFIEELLRSRREAPNAGGAIPESIKDVIGRRLERLPADTMDVLMTAAVLGPEFDLTTLLEVAGDVDVVAAVEDAVYAGLVVEEPGHAERFRFAHALVRETLYERPLHHRRLRIHLAVADALRESPVEFRPAELAHHYFIAREVGGAEHAFWYSMRAAEEAVAAHAYEEAPGHYEHALAALEIARPDDLAARADVLLALGQARWRASAPGPRLAFELAATVARDLGSPERLAAAALGAGGRYYAPGMPDPAYVALLEEALAALSPADSAQRAHLLARLGENLALTEPDGRAQVLAREAVGMARRIGEPQALVVALMSLHAALLDVEHAVERRRIAEEALALAGELLDDDLAALGRHWLVYDLLELGDLDQAARRRDELEALPVAQRQPLFRHSSLAWRGVWAGLAGRFDEAERIAGEALSLAERAGDPDARTHYTGQLVALRREQGRLHELLPEIERFAERDGPEGLLWQALVPLAHLDGGNEQAARDAFDAFPGDVPRTLLWLSTAASRAEAAARLGATGPAGELYAALETCGDRWVQTSFAGSGGSVRRLLGRLAATIGRHELAASHLTAALDAHRAAGAPALAARTACDLGELLLHGDDEEARRRGRRLLDDAAGVAGELGLTGIAARTAGALARDPGARSPGAAEHRSA